MENYSESEVRQDNAALDAALQNLSDISGKNGAVAALSSKEISLLRQMIGSNAEKTDDFIKIVQICDFLDEEEANNELAAYYEAVRLGMSTEFNIAHALSRASINRKENHRNSRVAALLDALSHQKFTSNQPGTKPVDIGKKGIG